MKKILMVLAAMLTLVMTAPAVANAGTYRSEEAVETWFEQTQASRYAEDFGYTLDEVWCDGYGRSKDRDDDDLYRKFRCESEFSGWFSDEYDPDSWDSYDEWEFEHEEWDEGVDDVDRVKARASGGFKLRTVDSDWW